MELENGCCVVTLTLMVRYFDTGLNGPKDSLGLWLEATLVPGVLSFRGQFGFFDAAALRPFIPVLEGVVGGGGTLRLVIGSNVGDPPATDDLAAILPLLTSTDRTSLTVVALSGALFHPKTMHIVHGDGRIVAAVSSANFTRKGLGHSVEAGVLLHAPSDAQTDAEILKIAQAIDRWASVSELGVYQVRSSADIAHLAGLGIAVTPNARRALRAQRGAASAPSGRGTRPLGWRPLGEPARASDDEPTEAAEETAGSSAAGRPVAPGAAVYRWAKVLKRSDAQQTPAGTNPTGKLRLGQARFPIDQASWFRDVLFGDQNWLRSIRRGVPYEEAHVTFHVARHGGPWEQMTLKIDHGTHRVANQNNIPTVVSWGATLGEWLRANDQKGKWVVIEKDENGDYWLSFQDTKPAWAP
jgi:hypothetical protein